MMINPPTVSPNASNSVLQQGLHGMKASAQSIQAAAADLVRAGSVEQVGSTSIDIVEPSVQIIKQQHVFDASAKVVKVSDQIKGTLIDMST